MRSDRTPDGRGASVTRRPRHGQSTRSGLTIRGIAVALMVAAVPMHGEVFAGNSAAEAQKAAYKAQQEALKAQQEALKRQQEAIKEAQKKALEAQKAAQEAARKAAQIAAQQAAAQKAAQQAAQKAAQQAAAQKAAADKVAQQAAAQKAAADKAAQQAAQAAKQQQTATTKAPTPAPTPSVPSTSNASPKQTTAPPQTVKPTTQAAVAPPDDGDDLPNDASVQDGVPTFGAGDFLKGETERLSGPARPLWAPDPSVLKAPRESTSIKQPEPVKELAKELAKGLREKPAPPDPKQAEIPSPVTPEDPATGAPPPKAPETVTAQPAAGPKRASGTATQLPSVSAPGEELLATGLTNKQVEVLTSLGVETQSVTMPASGVAVQRLRVPPGMSKDQLKATLTKQMPLTPFVPNHRFIIFGGAAGDAPAGDVPAQDACSGDQCFGAQLVHWSQSLNECTRDVKIGIIDTSFDTTHPAFRALRASHGTFLNGQQPSPLDWHGTAVLSELAGHPQSGTPGLIPHAHFFLAAAFRTDESGNASTDTVRLLSALEWMEALGVQYVNMSFTGPRDDLIETTIRRMSKKGIVFVAAAGNHGPNAPPSYPAAYPDVIAVTAINRKGESYRSANRGSYIDVAAPGVDIPAALPNSKQGLRTGTSFAAPFITAILAARNPQATTQKGDLLTSLRIADLGPPGRDPIYGTGLALAPERCGGEPAGTIASGRPAPAPSPSDDPISSSPTLSGFAPASAMGFR